MMVYLKGKVIYHGLGYLIVEQNGIGYRVSLPEKIAQSFQGEVEMYLHEVIRDSERELFGFGLIQQLELFWRLIAISGVGPRIAQKIVFSDDVDKVCGKIMKGDLASLTDVPGIGKKTAQKIILELKGVLADDLQDASLDQEALEGLMGLGYSRRDAQTALSDIDVDGTEDRIRAALKRLSR